MSITGLTFFILLILVWAAYYICPKRFRWISLLIGSVVFYASFGWVSAVVLLGSTLLTYAFGRLLNKNKNKGLLAASVIVTLVPLALSKASLLALIGVSFYIFSSISYIVDCYKDKFEPQKNYAKFLLYISFFPYIIEGPIARYDHLSKELYEGHDFDFYDNLNGMFLILWGLIKKLIVAERLGLFVETIFASESYHSTFYVLLGAFLYAIQLYLDFSGYVNVAEGVASMFSIRLQKNFKMPYFSKSIAEFWRNWHATLGDWLRDYVYIPLGGNRKGTLRKCVNVLIVFLVSGIWHGTTLTFILWGVYHGVLSVIDVLIKPWWQKVNGFVRGLVTFALVCFGWIFFRADNVANAFSMIGGLFKFESVSAESLKVLARNSSISMYTGKLLIPFLLAIIIVEILEYRKVLTRDTVKKVPVPISVVLLSVMIVSVICFSFQGGGAFLYEVF